MASFQASQPQSDPFYRTGHYLNEITLAKVNSRGEPYFTFKVIDSHDGGHINSYYTINFFMGSQASAASRGMWGRKFSELMQSCGVQPVNGEYNVELDQLIGCQVVLSYTKAGYNPLPNIMAPSKFDKLWQPDLRKTVSQWQQPPANQQDDVPFDPDAYESFMDIPNN